MLQNKILESASFRELYRFMIENKLSRKLLFKVVDRRLRRELVEINVDDRPRRVQELKHAYVMALLYGFDRAMARGHISRHVTERLLDTVLQNIIANDAKRDQAFGHGPLLLVVSPTSRCNLKCTGCYAACDTADWAHLDFDVFDRIVAEKKALWDSHLTVVSGGEPFMWRHKNRGLLDLVEKHPTEFFMLYSNGTLITDEIAGRMAELGNVSPAVSVEGFEYETDERRGKGVFKKILNTMDILRRHGVPFGISVTPTNKNWDLVTSDRFVDFWFDEQGAVYCWSFQYMPIGSKPDLDLMVTPENRLEMLKRTHRLIRDRKVFVVDFWNSGIASYGCISAGRADGHFHINWDGDVTPCVFVPYAVDNVYDVFRRGDDLNTLIDAPFFQRIQSWQDEYGFRQPTDCIRNWLCPCPMRDHFGSLRKAVLDTNARPLNEEAAEALTNNDYHRIMVEYAQEFDRLSEPMWTEEFSESAEEQVATQRER